MVGGPILQIDHKSGDVIGGRKPLEAVDETRTFDEADAVNIGQNQPICVAIQQLFLRGIIAFDISLAQFGEIITLQRKGFDGREKGDVARRRAMARVAHPCLDPLATEQMDQRIGGAIVAD